MLCSVARLYVDAKSGAKSISIGSQGVDTAAGAVDVGAATGSSAGSGDGTGSGDMLANVGMEFDTYLSALGLAPPAVLSSMGGVGGGDSGITGTGGDGWNMSSPEASGEMNPEATTQTGISQTTQLGNWFSGNQYMMGLLEEDLSLIDFSGWS